MEHYIYKTTNLVNGKFYYGKHSTDNINDGYLGSGKLLLKAINKYGRENFNKEILTYCESSEDAFELEELVVNQDEVENRMCYNVKVGGRGGGHNINHTECSKLKISNTKSEEIKQIDKDTGETIHIWKGVNYASRQLGLYQANISRCCRGERHTAYGFKWKYSNEKEM